MSWLDLVKVIGPIIIGAKLPHGDKLAPIIVNEIQEAEALKNAKGSDKLAHVVNETNLVVDGINAAYGTEKINKAAVNDVLADTVSAVVKGANVVKTSKTIVNK